MFGQKLKSYEEKLIFISHPEVPRRPVVVSPLVGGGLVLQSYPSANVEDLTLAVWPVLVRLLLALLLQVGDHHHHAHLVLHDHLPEVLEADPVLGSLCSNVPLLVVFEGYH